MAPSTPEMDSPVASEFPAGPLTPANAPPSTEFRTSAHVFTVLPSLRVAVYSLRFSVSVPRIPRKPNREIAGMREIWMISRSGTENAKLVMAEAAGRSGSPGKFGIAGSAGSVVLGRVAA